MSNETRVDRIEKARGIGVEMSRKAGSAYGCAWGAMESEPVKVSNQPDEYGLHRRGWTLAKIVGEFPDIKWAEDIDDPEARWCEGLAEYRCAQINAYQYRHTKEALWAAVDLIVTERRAGIEPALKW